MKKAALFLVLYLSSLLGLGWYLAITRQQDKVYQLETDRACKSARLQLAAQGVHCESAEN